MKNTKVLAVLQAIDSWCRGETTIHSVCDLLGDEHNEVGQMLMLTGMADFAYKPMDGFSCQDVINAVLLYVAMRGTMLKITQL